MPIRKSSQLIFITVCLLILLSNGGIYTIYVTKTISNDAEIVNKLGTIRGTVQRLVKLELNDVASDGLINDIDSTINQFADRKIKVYDQNDDILTSLHSLNQDWLTIKGLILNYRHDRSDASKKALLKHSEIFWDKSNNTVFVSQGVAERKIGHYKISYLLFMANLLLGGVIVFLINKYVRKNLEYLVTHDNLTQIYNRGYFKDFLRAEMQKVAQTERRLSLIMLDIDHFKVVNDTYGHDAGDYVLKEMTATVAKNLRKSDVFARLGGEEFVIIAPDTALEEAFQLAEKVRLAIADHQFEQIGQITISLGVTELVWHDNIDTISRRVDDALYHAKNQGRNRTEKELASNAS